MISAYAPELERTEEERELFLEELKWCINVCEDKVRLLVIEDNNV